jgi:hypothetical protein
MGQPTDAPHVEQAPSAAARESEPAQTISEEVLFLIDVSAHNPFYNVANLVT